MPIKSDLKTTVVNSFSIVSSVVSASTGVVCEASNAIIPMVDGLVPLVKEVFRIPERATAGYIMEHDGASQSEADARASAIFDRSAAQILESTSRFTGEALAIAKKELDEA